MDIAAGAARDAGGNPSAAAVQFSIVADLTPVPALPVTGRACAAEAAWNGFAREASAGTVDPPSARLDVGVGGRGSGRDAGGAARAPKRRGELVDVGRQTFRTRPAPPRPRRAFRGGGAARPPTVDLAVQAGSRLQGRGMFQRVVAKSSPSRVSPSTPRSSGPDGEVSMGCTRASERNSWTSGLLA